MQNPLPLWRKAQCEIESILGTAGVGELNHRIERALAAFPNPSGKRA